MKIYGGIDLHANNSMVVLVDGDDQTLLKKRMKNDLGEIMGALKRYQQDVVGLAVESTFNWYWLVDGLMDAGYAVHLAHPAAMKQYEGVKHTNDKTDARWLATMLRMGILPEGYIYPKESRPLRDLMRKRSQLVQQRTRNVLSIKSQLMRSLAATMTAYQIQALTDEDIARLGMAKEVALGIGCNCAAVRCLNEQIALLGREVTAQACLQSAYRQLLTVNGIGEVLALTIMLETGDIRRFPRVGDFSSYCRCVCSNKTTNGKRKGTGNRRNGNRYLAWAFGEAAHHAIRYNQTIRAFYQRKTRKTHPASAMMAVAHKLARACYYMLRDDEPFCLERAFA